MSFTIVIDAEGRAPAFIAGVTSGLEKSTAAAQRTTTAVGQLGTGGAQAGQQVAAGADRAADAHRRAKGAAEEHGGALEKLIHLAEAYFAVHAIEEYVDAWIEVDNKLRTVSTSQQNLNGLMAATFAVAQETRSSWEDVAATYQRLGVVTRGLGLSQQNVIDLTREMAEAAKVGGATNREAGAAMSELTHAFATGSMQSREFRVLMRDVPSLMHELQVASGKTGSEFAELGKKGGITAQLLIEWFGKAGPAIHDKFGQTLPTISDGFLMIKNAAEKFFGEVAVGTGALSGFSSVLKFVADHFDTIGTTILAVTEALVGLFVIEKIIVLVKALSKAVWDNPLGALLGAIVLGISLLRQFGDQMETSTKAGAGFVTVGDTLRAVWTELKRIGTEIAAFLSDAWASLTSAFSDGMDTAGLEASTAGASTMISKFVVGAIGMFHFLGDSIMTIFGGIPAIIGEAFVNIARGIVGAFEWVVNRMIDGINKLIEAKNWVVGKIPGVDAPTQVSDATRQAAIAWAEKTNDATSAARAKVDPSTVDAAKHAQDELYLAITHVSQAYAKQAELQNAMDRSKAVGITGPDADSVAAYEAETLQIERELAKQKDVIAAAVNEQAAAKKILDAAQSHLAPRLVTPQEAPGGYGSTHAENLLSHIDLDFKNPLDGAAKAFGAKFKADYKADVIDAMARIEAEAIEGSKRRQAEEANKTIGTVDTDKSKAEVVAESEKAIKAREKLANEFRAIAEASNPVTAAQEKLAHATTVVDKAVTAGIATWQRGGEVMADYLRREQDALDPMGAWVRKQIEQTSALSADTREMERNAAMRKFLDEQKKQGTHGGLGADDAEIEQARHMIEYTQERTDLMRAEQAVFSSVHGPARAYADAVKAIDELQQAGTLTTKQYLEQMDAARASYLSSSAEGKTTGGIQEAAWLSAKAAARSAGVEVEGYDQVMRKVRAQQIAAGPEGKAFMGAMEAGWIQLQQQAEAFGATVAGQVIGGIDKLNDTLVTAANTGSVSWSKMADSMLQDLERVALKAAEVKLIGALIGGGGGGGESDVSNALANNGLLHFATGGSFTVGGSGGTDSQTVIFRASPDERVTVQTPAQQRDGGGSRGPAPTAPVVNVHNHYDTDAFHAALTSRRGQQTLINTMRANKHLLR